MSDYIKRDDVLDKLRSAFDMQDLYAPVHFMDFVVDDLPAADVREIKHGYWEVVCSEPWAILKCSECGHKRQTERYPKFCEFCGAVMRGERDK